ncbi:hypothetical protein ACFVIM_08060 [Streptomyces sp. NPDC057638]|uniref:hypothetical protein n=1 Tax=Streptomyces sp. NPDC057638 TaxID=3346190 RepID=UPI0036C2B885
MTQSDTDGTSRGWYAGDLAFWALVTVFAGALSGVYLSWAAVASWQVGDRYWTWNPAWWLLPFVTVIGNLAVASPAATALTTRSVRVLCAAGTAAIGVLYARLHSDALPYPVLMWLWPVSATVTGMLALVLLIGQLSRPPWRTSVSAAGDRP